MALLPARGGCQRGARAAQRALTTLTRRAQADYGPSRDGLPALVVGAGFLKGGHFYVCVANSVEAVDVGAGGGSGQGVEPGLAQRRFWPAGRAVVDAGLSGWSVRCRTPGRQSSRQPSGGGGGGGGHRQFAPCLVERAGAELSRRGPAVRAVGDQGGPDPARVGPVQD